MIEKEIKNKCAMCDNEAPIDKDGNAKPFCSDECIIKYAESRNARV